MRRTAFALLVLATSAISAHAATDEELREQIVGGWGADTACTGASLTFNADGTFVLSRDGQEEGGSWHIAGGMLTGTTSDGSSRPQVKVRIEGNQLFLENEGQAAEQLTRCAS